MAPRKFHKGVVFLFSASFTSHGTRNIDLKWAETGSVAKP